MKSNLRFVSNNYNNQKFIKQNNNGQEPSFGGAIGAVTGFVSTVEKGGLAASFLMQDALGLCSPRMVAAYNRNKEELGHPNYKMLKEVTLRESLTGPSTFAVPALFVAASKLLLGPSVDIQFKPLEKINESVQKLVKNELIDSKNIKKEYYKDILNRVFDEHKKLNSSQTKNINKVIEKYSEKLINVDTHHRSVSDVLLRKNNIKNDIYNQFERTYVALSKKCGKESINAHIVNLEGTSIGPVKDFLKDCSKYSKGILKDLSKNLEKGNKEKSLKLLEKLHLNKVGGRAINLVLMALATSFTMVNIPKIYTKGNKEYPGMEGINKTKNVKDTTSAGKQVSFSGGLSTLGKKLIKSEKAFNYANILDYKGLNMALPITTGAVFGLVVFPRLAQARGIDEKREIITRDTISAGTLMFGLPILNKLFAKIAEKSTGFVLTEAKKPLAKDANNFKHFMRKINPFKYENLGTKQLDQLYSNINDNKNGLESFAKEIDKKGGNLSRIFNYLSSDSKSAISDIGEMPKDNKGIIKFFEGLTNKKAELFKKAKEQGKKALSEEELKFIKDTAKLNKSFRTIGKKAQAPLVKFAKFLYGVPYTTSLLLLTPLFLGYLLPKVNEKITKSRNEGSAPINSSSISNNLNQQQKDIFKQFTKGN